MIYLRLIKLTQSKKTYVLISSRTGFEFMFYIENIHYIALDSFLAILKIINQRIRIFSITSQKDSYPLLFAK